MALFSDKERVITGLLLLCGVLFIGWIDSFFVMWLALGVVYYLAFIEAEKLFGVDRDHLRPYAVVLWIIAAFYPYGDDLFVLAGVTYAAAVSYNKSLKWVDFLPFIYPTAGMLFILTMYEEYGIPALLWLLVVVALTDIGAYVVGKSIGKTPFSPTSPKKTREGVAGGIVVATLGGLFFGLGIVDVTVAFFISFFVSVASVFGDLFESSLKRSAGVKDSGDILPGHGGVLDRIDGYLFGGIVMLVLLRGLV
jgi:phosphatidate cytidylyltransferase